jgi:hypothetical protein
MKAWEEAHMTARDLILNHLETTCGDWQDITGDENAWRWLPTISATRDRYGTSERSRACRRRQEDLL